jgi:hypothetical protein
MSDKEYFADFPKLTVLPWVLWALAAVLIVATVVWATKAHAEPRYQAGDSKVRVVLHDEPCRLKDQITNLPYRIVWHEGEKTVEGCWGPRPDAGVAMAYFADKTMGLIPLDALTKVSGA